MIPYGKQDVNNADIDAVVKVLRSDFLTQGPAVPRFERHVAEYCGARYARAVTNATSALHLACCGLGVGVGDHVWVPAITFAASANCALYCGAVVDFVDVDPATYNLCPRALRRKLESGATLPKVVVAVHMAGQPCAMDELGALAREFGFQIIEDASHAIGSRYQNAMTGCCVHSAVTVFSFHPVKLITTGEGGMVLTNDAAVDRRIDLLRSHGITRDPDLLEGEPDGGWYYEQVDLGFNYRMTDIQAALGNSQLSRLDEYVARRNNLATEYDRRLADLPLKLPIVQPGGYSSFHLYIVRLDLDSTPAQRAVFEQMRQSGVGVNLHYIPVYRHPHYARLGFEPGYCPNAEAYYSEAMTLPLYPTMTSDELDTVVIRLAEAVAR